MTLPLPFENGLLGLLPVIPVGAATVLLDRRRDRLRRVMGGPILGGPDGSLLGVARRAFAGRETSLAKLIYPMSNPHWPSLEGGGLIQTPSGNELSFGGPLTKRSGWCL